MRASTLASMAIPGAVQVVVWSTGDHFTPLLVRLVLTSRGAGAPILVPLALDLVAAATEGLITPLLVILVRALGALASMGVKVILTFHLHGLVKAPVREREKEKERERVKMELVLCSVTSTCPLQREKERLILLSWEDKNVYSGNFRHRGDVHITNFTHKKKASYSLMSMPYIYFLG